MEQLQESSPQKTPGPGHRVLGAFLKFCSWCWGILAIAGGIKETGKHQILGPLLVLLGIIMLPLTRKLIRRRAGFKIAHPAAIGAGILAVIIGISHGDRKEKEAEQHRLMQIAREEEQRDSTFIASHPFVDRAALQAWRKSAADSTTDSSKRLVAFLADQQEAGRKRIIDSIENARQWREDSIASARQWRRDSMLAARRQASELNLAAQPRVEIDVDFETDKSTSRKRKYGKSGYRASSTGKSYSSSSSGSYSGSYKGYSSSSSSGRSRGGRGGRRR